MVADPRRLADRAHDGGPGGDDLRPRRRRRARRLRGAPLLVPEDHGAPAGRGPREGSPAGDPGGPLRLRGGVVPGRREGPADRRLQVLLRRGPRRLQPHGVDRRLRDGRRRAPPARQRRPQLGQGRCRGPRSVGRRLTRVVRPSPPPIHNFDVVPDVRSAEPLYDIRRAIRDRTHTWRPPDPARPEARRRSPSRAGAASRSGRRTAGTPRAAPR